MRKGRLRPRTWGMPLSRNSLAYSGELNGDSMNGTNRRSARPVSRGALQMQCSALSAAPGQTAPASAALSPGALLYLFFRSS